MKKILYVSHTIAKYRANVIELLVDDAPVGYELIPVYDNHENNHESIETTRVAHTSSGSEVRNIDIRVCRLGSFIYLHNLSQVIKSLKPSVVVFATTNTCLSMWRFAFHPKIGKHHFKTVWWSHGLTQKPGFLKSFIYKSVLHFHSILTYSYRGSDILREIIDENRTRLLRIGNSLNPILSAKYKPFCNARTYYSAEEPFTFLYIGRLIPEKKIELGIELVSELTKSGLKVQFLVVGNGPELKTLQNLTELLNVKDFVIFKQGTHNEEEIAAYYKTAHACLSPGNIGLLAVQATTYQCPILTHCLVDSQMPEIEILDFLQHSITAEKCTLPAYCHAAKKLIKNYNLIRTELSLKADNIIEEYFNPKKSSVIFWNEMKRLCNENNY